MFWSLFTRCSFSYAHCNFREYRQKMSLLLTNEGSTSFVIINEHFLEWLNWTEWRIIGKHQCWHRIRCTFFFAERALTPNGCQRDGWLSLGSLIHFLDELGDQSNSFSCSTSSCSYSSSSSWCSSVPPRRNNTITKPECGVEVISWSLRRIKTFRGDTGAQHSPLRFLCIWHRKAVSHSIRVINERHHGPS